MKEGHMDFVLYHAVPYMFKEFNSSPPQNMDLRI